MEPGSLFAERETEWKQFKFGPDGGLQVEFWVLEIYLCQDKKLEN